MGTIQVNDSGRMHHDMGGQQAGSIDESEHSHPDWEKRVDALMMLLSNNKRRIIAVDELRRGIESLGAEKYTKLTYYERWVSSITQNLIEKGIITTAELGSKMAEVELEAKTSVQKEEG